MKISQVSSSMMTATLRATVAELQSKYLVAQKEAATLRVADVGLHLGNRMNEVLSLRAQFSQLGSIKHANNGISVRMETTQTALTTIIEDAEQFANQLLSLRDRTIGSEVIQDQGETRLKTLMELLNTGLDGQYLFSGVSTQNKPIVDYYGAGVPSNKAGVDAALFAEFGITQDDPAAKLIDPADLQAFLDGAFADRFEEPAWSAEWSNASDTVMRDMISLTERIPTSVTANDASLRKLAKAYTMVAELGINGMSDASYTVIVSEATRLIGEAVQEIATVQAYLGNSQERLKFATEKVERQIVVLNNRVADMEAVDGYEAQVRVNELKTRIEASYELTVRVQSLSLLHYL